jgi:16S rRNA (guanine1207-N2)-methyltransferase
VESHRGSDASLPSTIVTLSLPDHVLSLKTEPGLFSHRQIDIGTDLLLRFAPFPPTSGEILDLGCGYGAVALALALRAPNARVWALDVDDRALQATEENVAAHGLSNVLVTTPRSVPSEVRFAAIYSNPPTRIGKQARMALLDHWLRRLRVGGTAYLVIKRTAGADSVAPELNHAGFRASRIVAKRGYRVIEVDRSPLRC